MRVLFFVSEYHRFYGAQHSLMYLLRHLPEKGVQPLALFPGEGLCVKEYRAAGIPVEVLQAPPVLNQFGEAVLALSFWNQMRTFSPAIISYSLRLAKLMRERKIDLLHCNSLRSLLLGAPGARLSGYPVVWHVRGKSRVSSHFQWLGAHIASRIVLVADALRADFPERMEARCSTIYNAVDIEEIEERSADAPDEELQGLGDHQPVIATMAAIARFKGLHYLMDAARLINQRTNGLRPIFLVIGGVYDQDYYRHLQELATSYEVDNVRFLGWKGNPYPYYRRAQLVVLPSVLHEGLPRSILEAMALGKPVVGTDAAGIPEQIIHGQTGLIVPQANPEALADAIIGLLKDPARATEMGRNARARAREHFNSELMVDKTKRVFEELIA